MCFIRNHLTMTTSKEKLIKIYKEAKRLRIVLNQAEFAKAIGYSRVHLFKKMNEIPEEILEKAQQLLETKNVSQTIEKQADVGDELNRLIELSIKHEASLDVLQLLIVNILAVQKGKEPAIVNEEVIQAIKMRADRLFDEYAKKK